MEHSGSVNSSIPGISGRSLALEIDLNESPLPSPREVAVGGGGGFAVEHRCGSCGEHEGAMVVCGDCGRRFHVECLGVREEQRGWMCFECLIECRSGRRLPRAAGGGCGSRLLDINASPPREADGVDEDYFVNSELVLAASFPKMQDMRRSSFIGFTFNSPITHSDMRFITSGFRSQNPTCSMNRISAHLNLETATQKCNLVYLQALKDYISEKRGILGDGWRVKFEYSETNCKTSAIYFAPDGSRFGSMSEVARYLGLISKGNNSVELEDKGSGIVLFEKGSQSKKRNKEGLKSQRANNLKEHKNMLRSKDNNVGNAMEVDLAENGSYGSQSFLDGFPVQFEDFFIISSGKIDPRPAFHNTCQIWPVDYRSIWHDKFTGSIFIFDILDGGEPGPIFRVHRYPCTTRSIPYASTVLCTTKSHPNDWANNNSLLTDPFHDDNNDTDIHLILTEHSPPHLDDDSSYSLKFSNIPLQKTQPATSENDIIGELSVEDRSLSSAWQKTVETLLHACRKAYNNKNVLNFCCNHGVEGQYINESYGLELLGKFCYLAGPINDIPDIILTVDELEASCEVLGKWLRLDRFGLDAEFVQEFIEQLPGVTGCSKYKSLNARCESSISRTVRSGFFTAVSKNGLQHETVSNSLGKTHKRPSPPGCKITSNLPPHLIGDVVQAYEVCSRFYEVLGQEAPVSREVLENELMNPWIDDLKPTKRSSNDFQKNGIIKSCEGNTPDDITLFPIETNEEYYGDGSRAEVASKCSGVKLAKFHMGLLKVLVEDVLAKVKEIFDPFGAVECKSRKGRKKDVDGSGSGAGAGASKKMNLDMFPVNEFTWPEIARRYILVVLATDGNLESSEVMARECVKVFLCLNGDGGTLCGSLTGVAVMEADAMVLAEASKKIFSCVKSKVVDFVIDQKENDTGDSAKEPTNVIDDDAPEWTQVLEPVRKLPTNVGARIRRCIHESLNKNPPEWAKKILEHSISKEVYKGNASGPTKRAVISVLEKVRLDNPQQKPTTEKKEKEKSVVRTFSDAVSKRCRIVLRSVAAADEDRVFFNLLAKTLLKPNDSDDMGLLGYPAMVSRPLDFRTIDLRLAAGFYDTSHESFIEDVREVWQNLRTAYHDRPDRIALIATLSEKLEEAYEQEVLNLANRIAESGNSCDSSNEESKKELNTMLLETSESSLPPAPWEDGVCKVCGMDKDDDSVLLCDKCDSEYHTYCLDPPLARIPEGNWYCPSCISSQLVSQDERCGTRALCRLRGNKKLRKEFTRSILETLAVLADTMELMEYWELGIEERVFLFKFLCDEALSSGIVRNHLGPDSADLEKKLRKLYKELKNQNKKEESPAANLAKETEDKCQEEYWSFSKPSNSQSQTENEENDENRHVGTTKSGQDQETVSQFKNRVSSLQEKITTLESKIAKPIIRREFLGRDLVGRLYWAFTGPDRVVVSGPQSRGKACASLKECEMTEMPEMYTSDYSLWTSYESDVEIQELVGWLRDDDLREKELKDTIKQWQRNRRNDDNAPQNGVENVQDNPSSSSAYGTKARAVLEKKFGSFLEHGAIQYLKKQGRKGKMVNKGKWYRCDCLELIGPTRHHCPSCHFTFLTLEELEGHNDGKCENRQEFEGPSKNKKTPLVKQPVLTDHHDEPESPFVFEEIRAKFCTRSSLKEEVKDIGLIGSNGIPSFICKVPPQNFNDALLLVSETKNWINFHDGPADFQILEKHGANETPSKVERLKPKGISGKSSLKNRSAVRICQSSLKPLSGRVLEIIRCLKINLFDIETALPKEALRPSRGGLDRIRAWWAFVKSAQSIYEMVQATIILEDMITTEYLRKEWWYWSSPSTAAKISTISALSLRIYALDAAIYYEKPPPSNQDPTEPVTPKSSKSEKKNPEKSNTKDSSEKLNPKNNLKSNADSKPAEASRPKTRSKKRARDSDS